MIPVPTPRAAVAAVALALLAPLSPFGLVATLVGVNVVLLLLLVGDAAAAPSPATIVVERRMPAACTVGEEVPVTWTVARPPGARSARPLRVGVADELAPSLAPQRRRFRVVVPADAEVDVSTTMRPRRRGRFVVAEIVVRVEGPLGLAARQGSRRRPHLLRVRPPFRSRDEAELRIRRSRLLEVGLRSTRGRGGGTDFEQLREYQPDDEFRRMDWAATARAGRPIVRTYRAERNQVVVMLVESGRSMAGRVDGVPRLEHAMDAAMALTVVATHLGDRVGLVAYDRAVRRIVPPATGHLQLGVVTDALFDLEPSLDESDHLGAFRETLVRVRRRSLLVLFTDLVEQAVDDSLIPALPELLSRHVVLVVAAQDPDVAAWATETPEDAEAAYRQAAAIATLAGRRRAAARLEAAGAIVVDEPPGRLAGRLADTYLGIKATSRL